MSSNKSRKWSLMLRQMPNSNLNIKTTWNLKWTMQLVIHPIMIITSLNPQRPKEFTGKPTSKLLDLRIRNPGANGCPNRSSRHGQSGNLIYHSFVLSLTNILLKFARYYYSFMKRKIIKVGINFWQEGKQMRSILIGLFVDFPNDGWSFWSSSQRVKIPNFFARLWRRLFNRFCDPTDTSFTDKKINAVWQACVPPCLCPCSWSTNFLQGEKNILLIKNRNTKFFAFTVTVNFRSSKKINQYYPHPPNFSTYGTCYVWCCWIFIGAVKCSALEPRSGWSGAKFLRVARSGAQMLIHGQGVDRLGPCAICDWCPPHWPGRFFMLCDMSNFVVFV